MVQNTTGGAQQGSVKFANRVQEGKICAYNFYTENRD